MAAQPGENEPGDNPWPDFSPPYSTIVADPPWQYELADRQGRDMPYSMMSVDEISRPPIYPWTFELPPWTTPTNARVKADQSGSRGGSDV